ncbi:MAG: O-antigen ligase family protein [Phaeodactylibacter sp.]|nr:O-antigen ligase family protein [Phaeodactylibacter sp.]
MQELEKQHLVLFFYAVTIAALVLSPFLLSVGMISLAVLSLIRFRVGLRVFWVDIDAEAIRRMLRIFRYPPFAAVTLFFFVALIGFWQVEDFGYWLARLRIKVPFLTLPLVFLGHPRLEERHFHGLLYFLLLLLAVTAVGVGINYWINYEDIQLLLKQGQPMPTPRNHIRYSLMLALGVVSGGYLYSRGYYRRYAWERGFILGIALFLFLFIHLLSVRSGILALYAALFLLSVRYLLMSRRYGLGLGALAALIAMPLLAYQYVPSFRAKVDYMRWGLIKFREGEGAAYADTGRIVSLKVGWELYRQHPLFGVGAGNLQREVDKVFERSYPQLPEPLVPHNQFLFVLAGSGAAGLMLFLFALFHPFFYHHNYRHPFLLGFYGIVLTAFMIEHTIENSMGVGFFAFFLLLFLNMRR